MKLFKNFAKFTNNLTPCCVLGKIILYKFVPKPEKDFSYFSKSIKFTWVLFFIRRNIREVIYESCNYYGQQL